MVLLGILIIGKFNSFKLNTTNKIDEVSYIDSLKNKINIDSCFNLIDTSNQHMTIGCVNHFYTLLDDATVISTQFPRSESFLGCENIIFNPPGYKAIQLLIYEKGKAHLENVCTCLINTEAPKPIKTYTLISGDLLIVGIAPPDTFWNGTPFKSTLFEKAIFQSADGDQKIIRNKLFYNIPDMGQSG